MSSLLLHVPAIECAGCANSIVRSLRKLAGVEDVSVDVEAERVSLQFDAAAVSAETIADRLSQIGFPPAPEAP